MDWDATREGSEGVGRPRLGSWPGDRSEVFSGKVGETYPAAAFDATDYLIDATRYDSEGDWAFCRFSSEEFPAVRLGFQLGSFNIGPTESTPDPSLLQLHLEVMTRDGGMLWVPTGRYPGDGLESSTTSKDVRITDAGIEILRISGWPRMAWHMRSDDDELEVQLELDVAAVTVLPDCLLPHSIFAMWETLGRAKGRVRVGSLSEFVEGHVFYDHTRILHRRHVVAPRGMYLYTTMALEDGGGIFGYHALDDAGDPIDYYCFGIHVDADGQGSFLADARSEDLAFDEDGLPSCWRLTWQGEHMAVEADITVEESSLKRGWGGPMWPRSRARFSIIPLVLDGQVRVSDARGVRQVAGRGLAEYFDADKWFSS